MPLSVEYTAQYDNKENNLHLCEVSLSEKNIMRKGNSFEW